MNFENTAPRWDAQGSEPTTELKTNGFLAGYKPPAAYFNYLFNKYTACINELQNAANELEANANMPILAATSTDGIAYTATDERITELHKGLSVLFVPDKTTASTEPTFNLNGFGEKYIRRKLSLGMYTTTTGQLETMFYKDRPVFLMFDGTYWLAMEFTKPCANDLYGFVPIEKGGTGAETAEEARENLGAAAQEDLAALKKTVGDYTGGGTKNLLQYETIVDDENYGSYCTVNDDGSITIANTSSGNINPFTTRQDLEAGTYTASITSDIEGVTWYVGRGDTVLKQETLTGTKTSSFTFTNSITLKNRVGILLPAGKTAKVYLQIEAGSEATEFENHNPSIVEAYATKAYVDQKIGEINAVLESLVG